MLPYMPASGRTTPPSSAQSFLAPLWQVRAIWAFGSAATATAAIGTVFLVVGETIDVRSAVFALAGAMAVLYGRGRPYLHRASTVVTIAATITALSLVATVTASTDWGLLATLTAGAAVAAMVTDALRTPVPGPTIVLVAATIVAAIPQTGSGGLFHRTLMLALGGASALIATLSPWVLRRHGPETKAVAEAFTQIAATLGAVNSPHFLRAHQTAWTRVTDARRTLLRAGPVKRRNQEHSVGLGAVLDEGVTLLQHALVADRRGLDPRPELLAHTQATADMLAKGQQPRALDSVSGSDLGRHLDIDTERAGLRPMWSAGRLAHPARLMTATLASGAIAVFIGLDRWYWAPVCAVATIWSSDTWVTVHRALQRAGATIVGAVGGVALVDLHLNFAAGAVLVAALFFAAELLFPRNYGYAMTPVSAMIVLIIGLASPVAVDGWALAGDRVVAAILGSILGVLTVLTVWPTTATRQLHPALDRSSRVQQMVEVALQRESVSPVEISTLHAELVVDLLALDRARQSALGELRGRRAVGALETQADVIAGAGLEQLVELSEAELGNRAWALPL